MADMENGAFPDIRLIGTILFYFDPYKHHTNLAQHFLKFIE